MAIAITEDHQALAATASHFLRAHEARRASRSLLESETEAMPEMWGDLAGLGWLGIHLPEEHGGAGYGLAELVVLVEELAKAVAPGPFVPCVVASAVLDAAGDVEMKRRYLPGLAAGSLTGAVALEGSVTASGTAVSGEAAPVLGGGLAQLLLVPVGDDVAVVEVGEPVEVGPGPEGAVTKLVSSELGAEAAAILTELAGPKSAFFEDLGALSNSLVLMHRGLSIAGGTSEIKRNQIGERTLGLPRDPLVG